MADAVLGASYVLTDLCFITGIWFYFCFTEEIVEMLEATFEEHIVRKWQC